MMELREKIARAICGNWVVGDDRPWQQWTEEADAVLEVFRQATLTDTFVQPVPDRCDRIIWRGAYYHLPIAQAAVPKAQDTADLVSKALRQAYRLGQTYWQQADSDRTKDWTKADATQEKFHTLVDETRAALLASENP